MEWSRSELRKKYSVAEMREMSIKSPLMWVYTYQPQIRNPGKGLETYEPYYHQQQILRDRGRFRHINKSRQIGYTTTFAIEALHDFIYTPSAEIIVLSKSEKEAKKFLDKFYVALASVEDKDPHCPEITVRNTFNAKGSNGSTIDVLTSSKGAGRSFSASRLYFDEMAHTQFADDIYQASIPTISTTGGAVTLFSSPKGRGGLFAEIGRNTEDQGFSGHTYEWWWHAPYNPNYKEFLKAHLAKDHKEEARLIDLAKKGDWYRLMRNKFSDLQFAQEYEASYDADEASVFNSRQMKKTFRKNWMIDVEDGIALECMRIEPEAEHHYSTGIDLGRKRDATVIVTFDTTDERARMVEYKRIPPASSDWGLIERAIRETYNLYNSDMIHDATGVGDAISERIIDISEPFQLTASKKYNVIENLRRAMDLEAIELPRLPRIWREFEEYIWEDKHIVQDIVIAIALATKLYYEPDNIWTGAESFSYVEGEE